MDLKSRHGPLENRLVSRQVQGRLAERIMLAPFSVQLFLACSLIFGVVWPATLLLSLPFNIILLVAFSDQRFRLPLRIPMDVGGFDISTEREESWNIPFLKLNLPKIIVGKAKGVLCLGIGRGRDRGKELWLESSDALRHMQIMATTGGGKTETLYSLYLNALCWARGCCISDGKAQIDLAVATWSMARRFGQEDDWHVLNFITGNDDRFKKLMIGDKSRPQSNSTNPFAYGSPTFIIQLMESLLPAGNGSDEGWKDKARAMMNALIYALCYKRARDNIMLTQAVIQSYLPLIKFVGLYREALEEGWHEEGYKPMENYLANLAGFDMKLINRPGEWSQGALDQHGYLIQQFTRMLSMFNDTYGHVFPKNGGDIDMQDILHNDRTLVVLIPALELSDNEAATLGKLYISDIRMNIAKDLGNKIEGSPEHTLTVKKFASKFPFMLICDEVGYYFAPGLEKLAAQMRSLKYMLVILAQDLQAMMRHGKEVHSVNANLGTKQFMKTEDTEDTLKMIRAVGGTGQYAEQRTMSRTGMGGYEDVDRVEFRDRDNIQLDELKALKEGQGIIVFEDRQVRSSSIYIPDNEKISKLNVKINRYVPLRRPDFSDLCNEVPAAARRRPVSQDRVSNIIDICRSTLPGAWNSRLNARLADKTLMAITSVATDLDNRDDLNFTPEQRGILLFETAIEALEQTGGRYYWLKEQESIRISKKRIEEAHRNSAGITLPSTSQREPVPDQPPPIGQHVSQPISESNRGYDDWYQNITQHDYSDDFTSTSDDIRY
ncbi:TraM recognition domain-containing protein [Enterobacter asburiae]|jgi:intracellular multiplication protein IcmO|uniref:F-type conjugative transfer protein TrbC n=1 Tax=Enterobacterales TaxID=91347 RepID=UPI0004E73598|nr:MULTISPECIES: F-type conjugative transfer protein TrbC [Enterobacterales]EEQ0767266.1 type IV secretory system conjugative DNA transfer family protein [Salmonella enterica]EEZ6817803.1 type IV secretory system conjugative DNA transfer family protein [Escherichia coli]EKV5513559.1 TraM recognition domain-containing protein [Klebsiella pneumoniae]HAV1785637.1 type IV secretory system conjugative DNA transfer family protein [Enterobacter hormaechei subsp. steigerwaltii]HDR2627805.1 TraM recogn